MPSVLMLCYYYPPLGGIGSQRSQKFASYLPDYGWHPIVLTPKQGSYLVDHSLDDGGSKGVEVVRTGYIDLSANFKRAAHSNQSHQNGNGSKSGVMNILKRAVRTWVYIPDGQVGWYPYAVRAGRRAIETENVDAIYSSSFPVTAHLAACRLKLATNKPWIADFRDLWTENHYADYSSAMRKRLDQIIESELLEKADCIITVSNAWADVLRRLTGGRRRVEVIRNGFDRSEFASLRRKCPDKWTITYVGNFYGTKQDPSVFFQSLRRVIESRQVKKEDVHLKIVGEPDPYAQEVATGLGLSDITSFTGFVSHGESLAHQVNSSMLLLILHGDKTNLGHVPGKLYEYLGARRPVLAIMPSEFEAARIIRETGAGVTVEAKDTAAIDRCLIDSYLEYKSASACSMNERDLSQYERRYGAKQLADILSELAL
ncbi:MAG TPA: glycosyltransferase family 4 protein [Blastocatellia bacterium]|nr:glycosyltransferase family 4 protein [Blastocatellia bacterium]